MRQGLLASGAAASGARGSPAIKSRLSRTQIRMLATAMMGGALEYYEFMVFGFWCRP